MLLGYIRVSTIEQNEARQLKMMEEQKVEKIFIDKASGRNTDRKDFKAMMDPNKVGGTAFIGISKPVIKAHGSSNAKAFKNAIRQAIAYCDTDISGEIESALKVAAEKKAEREAARSAKEEEK